jgi:2,3-bisphosphoglycerate-independent phosphoglycerate mutase
MDRLAGQGLIGRCRTIPEGMPPGSDIANMGLLGFDPLVYHTGRGPIEASAQGLDLSATDIVYRLNLCTVSEFSQDGVMLDYCAGHVKTETASRLVERLQKHLEDGIFRFITGLQYRHLLIQKDGADTLEAGLEITPPHDLLNQSLAADIATYKRSPGLSRLVFEAAGILGESDNPSRANAIWPWGQGRALQLPSFRSLFQRSGGVVSAVDLVKGLGRAARLEVPDIPGATGLLDTDYEAKVQATLDILERCDFVYVHLEGPDECSHAGDIRSKIEAIERFDRLIVGPLLHSMESLGAASLIACDHLTPISERTHTRDPVPFLFYNPQRKEAGPGRFSERSAAESDLWLESGQELLPWIERRLEAAS